MKKISQGLQFNVYSKGNKVIKIPTSKFQMVLKLIKWTPTLILKPIKLNSEINKGISIGKTSIENIQKYNINLELLGNPIFHKNKIEQDKVEILGSYLKKDLEEAKKWIDKFILLIFECWKEGFSERVFNLTINNGVDKNNNVILIDIGELTFEKKDVVRAIKIRRWEKSWSYNWDLNKEIKEYYQREMKEKLTLKNLNKYWNINKSISK
ncbi:MAG: hypothetical protein ACOCRX_12390 [Candidatus Woesearchaeota archaeon]